MELTTTLKTTVTEDQIDHLGHMNVRFYGANARQATEAFLAPVSDGVEHRATDLYTRHFAEQLAGASLAVRTGVLGQGPGWVRLYHELVNVEHDVLAASFVQRHTTTDPSWPATPEGSGLGPMLDVVPERGRPRSVDLSLDPEINRPSLDRLRALDLATRHERTVGPDEVVDGVVPFLNAPMLVWAGEPIEPHDGPILHEGPNGELIGWASMESRLTIGRLPRLGDRIQSFGVVLDLADKTSHRMMWAYDVTSGDLLVGFEVVDVALDTRARRAVSIPPAMRERLERKLHPEFGAA